MNATYGRRLMQLMVLALALCLAAPLMAADKAEKAPDYFYKKIVDFDYVKNYVKMPKLDGVTIIDSRPYMGKHVKGYIPTSLSIPDLLRGSGLQALAFLGAQGRKARLHEHRGLRRRLSRLGQARGSL